MNARTSNIKLLLYLTAVFTACFLFFSLLQNPNSLPDPDSYYHAKMARLMIEKGLVFETFPSMSLSILKDNYVDYHFLYHVSLIPFVSLFGDLMGVRIATIAFTSLFLVLFYFILQRNHIKYPGLYLLLLASVPTFILRLSIVKANAVSLCFLFMGINLMLKKKHTWLLLLSMVYVWFYGGFILLTGASIVYIISFGIKSTLDNSGEIFKAKIIYGRVLKYFFKGVLTPHGWKTFFILITGNLLGMLINPYAIANFKFYWVQVYEIAMVGSPAGFDLARGWYSISGQFLLSETMVLFIALILLISLLLLFRVKVNLEFIFLGALTIAFMILSKRSLRMFEYSAPISVWFIAVGFNLLFQSISKEQILKRMNTIFKTKLPIKGILVILTCIVIYIGCSFTYAAIRDVKIMLYNHPLDHLSGPANWLKDNTLKDSIVFNAGWDDWPFLFYFNDHNNYLVGLDPIFMYEYDADKYTLWFKIINGKVKENLASIIMHDFNARHVVLSKKRKFQSFLNILTNNPNITKTFEDSSGFVFKIEE